jgi:uncharacterized protein
MIRPLAFVMLLPRNACVLILRAYRAVISPLYGDVCRYYPSCSAYALGAIQQHGVVKGVALGTWRLARCHPWAKGGVDDVPPARVPRYQITRFGFVVKASDEATTHRELTHA